MRCIFCKSDSNGSVSVEHIIPESLGNIDHILPAGWVCDSCNNYLALKVEKPFLDSLYGRNMRFEMRIPNKKGRIPPARGWHPQSRTEIDIYYSETDGLSVGAAEGEDGARWIAAMREQKEGSFLMPYLTMPENSFETSRFVCKIGLEILAFRWKDIPQANDEIVDNPALDEIRRYVRLGIPKITWPISVRQIYKPGHKFSDKRDPAFQVLHEFTILVTPTEEYYAVVAIFGVEYTINLGGPVLEGYENWLKNNDGRGPLYTAPNV